MTKVVAYDLENRQVSSPVEFMTATSSGQFVLKGKNIEVTGLSNKRVKFLLRKFLHVNHLSGYGVLDTAGVVSRLFTSSLRQERKKRSMSR